MAIGGYHTGSNSLAAGSWSGGSTMSTANYELVISGGASQQDITDSLDQSATAGRFLKVAAPFVKNIGSKASPAILQISDGSNAQRRSDNTEGTLLYQARAGEMWVQPASSNGIGNVFVDSGGVLGVTGAGLVQYAHIRQGGLRFEATSEVAYVEAWGGNTVLAKYTGAGANPTQIDVYEGAAIEIYRPVNNGSAAGTLNIYGGVVKLFVDVSTASLVVNLFGGELIHYAGNITTMNHYAGVHNASNMNRASTITTCIRRPNAVFKGSRSSDMLTVTNDYTIGFPQFKV